MAETFKDKPSLGNQKTQHALRAYVDVHGDFV